VIFLFFKRVLRDVSQSILRAAVRKEMLGKEMLGKEMLDQERDEPKRWQAILS